MIIPIARINLLPYRERRVKELRVHFFTITAIVMVIAIIVVLAIDSFLSTFVVSQQIRVQRINQKIVEQDGIIKEIAKLKKDIEALIGKKSVIEDLQDDKNSPIRLFNTISKSTPAQGLYIESFSQNGQKVKLSAIADGNARISNFISNLENTAGVFKNVRLGKSAEFSYGTQKFFKFNLIFDCTLFKK